MLHLALVRACTDFDRPSGWYNVFIQSTEEELVSTDLVTQLIKQNCRRDIKFANITLISNDLNVPNDPTKLYLDPVNIGMLMFMPKYYQQGIQFTTYISFCDSNNYNPNKCTSDTQVFVKYYQHKCLSELILRNVQDAYYFDYSATGPYHEITHDRVFTFPNTTCETLVNCTGSSCKTYQLTLQNQSISNRVYKTGSSITLVNNYIGGYNEATHLTYTINNFDWGPVTFKTYPQFIQRLPSGYAPCNITWSNNVSRSSYDSVPIVDADPSTDNWKTIDDYSFYRITQDSYCEQTSLEFKVLNSSYQENANVTNSIRVFRNYSANWYGDALIQVNLDRYFPLTTVYFKLLRKSDNTFSYYYMYIGVSCTLQINQNLFTNEYKPVSATVPDWQPYVNLTAAFAQCSHRTGCPITVNITAYNQQTNQYEQMNNTWIKQVNDEIQIDYSQKIGQNVYIYFKNVAGYQQQTSGNYINIYCAQPTINNKADVEQDKVMYIPLVFDPNPKEIITVTTTLTSNNQSCVHILTLFDDQSNVYNTSAQQFAVVDVASSKLQTYINIRQSKQFKIGYKINGGNNVMTNSFKIDIICNDLVQATGAQTTYTIDVPSTQATTWTKIIDAWDIFPAVSQESQCLRVFDLYQGGNNITRTAVTVGQMDYFDQRRYVYINPNLNQSKSYVLKARYSHQSNTLDFTFNVVVQCTNSSNTFSINMTNSTNDQIFEITEPPTNPQFKILGITASQTQSCRLTKVELNTQQQSSVTTPQYFSPASITTLTYPLVFSSSDQTNEIIHQFYIKLTYEGGFTFASLGGSALFKLDQKYVCTGTPKVTLSDTTPIRKVYPTDGNPRVINFTQALVDSFVSNSWNCKLRSFEFLDGSKSIPNAALGVTFDYRKPFADSKLLIDTNVQINGTYFIRGKTDLGGQDDLEVQVYTCGNNSLQRILPLVQIVDVIPLNYASFGFSDELIVRTSQELSKLWTGPDCSGCIPIKGLVKTATNETYAEPFVVYNATTDALHIKTEAPRKLDLGLDVYFKNGSDCGFIQPTRILIDILVCGNENVVSLITSEINYTIMIGEFFDDIKITFEDVKAMFNTTEAKCNLTYFLGANKIGDPALSTAPWSSYVSLNELNGLQIKHLNTYPTDNKNNYTHTVYIRAASAGKKEAFRQMNLNFFFPVYIPPYFETDLKDISITFTTMLDVSISTDTFTYNSPMAVDSQNDTVLLSNLKITPPMACKCATLVIEKTKFKIIIEKSQLSEVDATSYTISVNASDWKASQVFSFKLKVTQLIQEPPPVVEPPPAPAINETKPVEQAKPIIETKNDTKNETKILETAPVTNDTQAATEDNKAEEKPKPQGLAVGAAFNPWVQKASAEEIQKLMMNSLGKVQKPKGKVEEVEPQPVILRIREINRNGNLYVEFNQKLMVPAFIDRPDVAVDKKPNSTSNSTKTETKRKRDLIPLSALEVQRDIMDFVFVLNSKVNPEDIKFFLEIMAWDEYGMELFINFTNPLLISQGIEKDQVICKVLNKNLFMSYDGREVLRSDRIYIQEKLPRQLPVGVSEEKLLSEASTASNGMKAIFIIQIVLQICLKGALNDFWVMFFTLQIICYLKIYDVAIPGNADIYITEFTKLIEFDVLNPDSIISLITSDPDFKLMDWIMGKSKFNSNGSPSMVDDLRLYIMGAAAGIAVLILLGVLMMVKKYKKKIIKLIKGMYQKFVFNGTIRSITIMYIQLCMSFGGQIKEYMRGNSEQTTEDRVIALILFIAMFGYPILCWVVIQKYKQRLETPEIAIKISNLYQEVRLKFKQNWKLVYYPLFLTRRIIFVAIPTFLYQFPTHQVQLLIFLTSLYILFYMGERPHWDTKRVQIEVFNELMILGACYHLICFSDFNLDVDAQFNMGYSFVALIILVVLVNVVVVIRKQYVAYKKRKQFQALKRSMLLALEASLEKKKQELEKREEVAEVEVLDNIDPNFIFDAIKVEAVAVIKPKSPKQKKKRVKNGKKAELLNKIKKLKNEQQKGQPEKVYKTPHYNEKISLQDNLNKTEDIVRLENVLNDVFGNFGNLAEMNKRVALGEVSIADALQQAAPQKQQDTLEGEEANLLLDKIMEKLQKKYEGKKKGKNLDMSQIREAIIPKIHVMMLNPNADHKINVKKLLKEQGQKRKQTKASNRLKEKVTVDQIEVKNKPRKDQKNDQIQESKLAIRPMSGDRTAEESSRKLVDTPLRDKKKRAKKNKPEEAAVEVKDEDINSQNWMNL